MSRFYFCFRDKPFSVLNSPYGVCYVASDMFIQLVSLVMLHSASLSAVPVVLRPPYCAFAGSVFRIPYLPTYLPYVFRATEKNAPMQP